MSRLLAVTARELRERWLLFPASLAFGLNPLVLPAFGVDRRAMPFVGIVTAVGLAAAAALIMGSTMLARDAANGRLGFLFTRPLSWPTIWGGKWLAAIVLVAGSGVLAAIPFMVAYPSESHGGSWLGTLAGEPGWALVFGALLLGVAIVNFAATVYRSRSPWVTVDMIFLVAMVWFARGRVAPLWLYGVLGKGAVAVAVAPLAVGFLAASAVQTAVGRTDVTRAHRAMSLVFWAVVGVALAVGAGYWSWVRSAGPADMDVYAMARDPGGRFVYVDGTAARGGWYPYRRLVDTASGRWLSAPEPDPQVRPGFAALFSADGRYGALPVSDASGAAIVRVDLVTNPPRAMRIGLESSPPLGWWTSFALSPTAASVFVAHESGASIFSLPSGRRVATMTIVPGWRPAATRYLGEDVARAWFVPANEEARVGATRAEMRVLDLAVDGKAQTSEFAVFGTFDLPFRSWPAVLPDAEGRRIVTRDAGVHLRDGATGALLATLVASGADAETSFLRDGRVVVGESRRGDANQVLPGSTLRVFDHDGAPLAEMPLDLRPPGLGVGPEVAPGRILVSSYSAPFLAEDTLVVDVAEGRVVDRLSGLRPVRGVPFGPPASAAESSFGSVQFFRDAAGRVVRIDFAGGSRAIVAGPGAPAGERLRLD